MTPEDPQRLFAAIYTDEDVGSHPAPALRRRGYEAQSAVEADNLKNSDEAQLTYVPYAGWYFLPITLRILFL